MESDVHQTRSYRPAAQCHLFQTLIRSHVMNTVARAQGGGKVCPGADPGLHGLASVRQGWLHRPPPGGFTYIYIYYVSTTAGLSSAEPTPPSPKEGGAAVCMTDDAQGLLWIGRGVSSTVKCPPHSRYTYIFESANYTPLPHLGTSPGITRPHPGLHTIWAGPRWG